MKSRRHSLELTTISQNGSLICHPEHQALVAAQTARRSAILPTGAPLETHLRDRWSTPSRGRSPGRYWRCGALQPLRPRPGPRYPPPSALRARPRERGIPAPFRGKD